MNLPPRPRWRPSLRDRYEVWKAGMTLRHVWFRVLLHLQGMARCPRNIPWHWRHILLAFHARKPRP